jgi:diazepam-binding inhibitor (GABA receptor modulator, acyl-CoA-binding protein)
MELQEKFEQAKVLSKTLAIKPDNETLLKLYALYKQGKEGDAPTEDLSNPFDFVAKAKYAAWQEQQGIAKEAAQQAYIDLVNSLLK